MHVLDILYVVLLYELNQSASKATAAENRNLILEFLTPVELDEKWTKCQFFVQELGPNH